MADKDRPAKRGPTMQEKVELLRELVDDVGLATVRDLADRWNVGREAARKFMSQDDAPAPVLQSGDMKWWALPEADRYRSLRLRRGRRST